MPMETMRNVNVASQDDRVAQLANAQWVETEYPFDGPAGKEIFGLEPSTTCRPEFATANARECCYAWSLAKREKPG